jgi:hypothetical protein
MSRSLRASALATAVFGALALSSANAAVTLSNTFDGSFFNPAQNGRGALVDVVKLADGSVVYAMALYTYNAQGNPEWLLIPAPMGEFQYSIEDAPVFRFSGGSFGNPFAAPTGAQIGTARINVRSCNRVTVDLTMNAGTGLPNTSLDLNQAIGSTEQCVYQTEFTGCPDFATAAPAFGDRACQISGDILGRDITLANHITWVLEGKVGIGGDNAQQSTLRIEPGTLIVGSGDTFDHLAVNRGSKIYAEGQRHAPIVMTSPFELPGFAQAPQPKDIGGFVISGNAPANCNPNCVAEWDPTNRYGGTNPNDDSGVVRFMQVRYGGYIFTTNRELNSFTLNGVGASTTLEYLQSYKGGDDGIEFFGGTARVRNFVDTCGGDDAIDWDEGFSGAMQFALVDQRGCDGQDHGFEVSNSPTNFDATPRARPTIANVTLKGGGAGSRDAFNIKEGTGGNWHNIIATGFARSCITIEGAPTQAAAGPANNLTGVLTINNSIIDCATNFRTGSGVDSGYTQAWFTAQAGNEARVLNLNGYLPTAQSNVLGKRFNPGNDHWFAPTDYAGAFRSADPKDDWTQGWTHDAR